MREKEAWNLNTNERILGIELEDITEDNQKEIIAYTKSGDILVISQDGKILSKDKITKNTPIWNVKLCDIDSDGKKELIIGGLDGLLRVFRFMTSVELKLLWAHQFGSSISGIKVNDINLDENIEIIAYSLDKSIRVLNSFDGSLIWGQNFEDGIEDACVWLDPNDLNKKRLSACGNDGTIRVFDGTKGDLIWFKRYTDKIRFIEFFNSNIGNLIICGGDDQKAHFIDTKTTEEIKTIEFNDYVWKCISFPTNINSKLLISSYSFDYFNNSKPLEDNLFSSKLIHMNDNLEVKWELNNKNIEVLNQIQINQKYLIVCGTTNGELIILDEANGNILVNLKKKSCVNDIKFDSNSNILISCHDDGTINTYFIDDS